ncbi:hypothetical protein [Pseudoalteromonas sp. MMG005]|uniref:hypothetical protein n=1 Tax=Pseudoalteromonas sp. MMG005 TaxID=2822682 RepID=UPI001B39E4E7|nr:hypothetical protein [Pseudoalteromonas sp. MMG005]MBQ4844931.1 hypothetical protein [Pseudoalteromonas sp. MMG005]
MAYSIGTISIQKNSSIITGSNTLFERVAKAQNGDLLYFRISEQDHILQVFDVISDTQIKANLLDGTPFNPAANARNIGYGLIQNFAATTPAKLAKGIAELQAKWHRRESELTGWFTSTADTHVITNFLGEAATIPTPAKIAELAQVAMTASSDLATIAQEIAANQQSLATVAPRINAFDAIYPQVISANNNVITKHDEIVLTHNEIKAKASDVNAHAEQVAVHKQAVFELKQSVQQAAELVSLDKTHSHAAAAICATAKAQTHADVQQVQADKTAIEQVKNDLNALGDSLSSSVTNAKQTINEKAHTTEQHINHVGAQIRSYADSTKAAITRTAQQFDANTAKRASSTEQYAHNAIRANNNVTITHDQVVQIAQQVSRDLGHISTLKSKTLNAQRQTQLHNEQTSLDALHSKANAALCATAAAQTQADLQQVQVDKIAIEQVKNDLSALNESLSNTVTSAVTNAKEAINTKAHTTEQHITNVGAQVSAHADNTKADITRTAQQFDKHTSQRASSTEQHAHSAIRANNQVTITHEKVVQTAQQVSTDVAQVATLKNSATNAQQQTERHSAQTSLDALHSKASAALCALSINSLAQQNAKLNTALNAALNNTLTAQQINQLFPV